MLRPTRTTLGALALALVAAACSDTSSFTSPSAPQVAPPQLNVSAAPLGAVAGTRLRSVAGTGQCLAFASPLAVTPAVLVSCVAGAAGQQLEIPAVGVAGAIRAFGGSQCLDDFGGKGKQNDWVGIYHCFPNAVPQTWTLTSGGELRGINDLCVDASQALTGGTMTLQPCNGTPSQRWAVDGGEGGTPVITLPGAGRFDSPLTSGLGSNSCLTVAASIPVTPASVALCAQGSAAQKLNLPPVGTSGLVQLYGGAVCLDNFGGKGRVGDRVGAYMCFPGAAPQTWTLTSAGQLKGINGLCVDANTQSTGGVLTLQTCTGATSQRWTSTIATAPSGPPPATVPPATIPVATRIDARVTQPSSGLCVGSMNGSNALVTPAVLVQCAAETAQLWNVPSTGSTGNVYLFAGTRCLDDFGGRGKVGDLVGLYSCAVPSVPTQSWMFTANGQLTGVNGLCVGVAGGRTDAGAVLSLQTCDGSAAQTWQVTTSTATTPLPAVTPPPTAPVPAPIPAPIPAPVPPPVVTVPPVSGASPAELPRAFVNTDLVPSTGKVIRVNAGDDLQKALDNAHGGDVVEIQAGATFIGNFWLIRREDDRRPNDWITIRTSAADWQIPAPGQRMSPVFAPALPKLMAPTVAPALRTTANAHHYRLIGLEITAIPAMTLNYNLMLLGEAGVHQNALDEVPHHIVLDRMYVHGNATLDVQRCISLNSAHTAIIDSYIADCHSAHGDNQAIMGWNGPGPFKIVNNFLEGAGENVMFGGSDPSIAGLIPSDIEIRRNHMFKPLSWRGKKWVVKNSFELKNAKRVLVEGNIFENNWLQGQDGVSILMKSTNQGGGCRWCVTKDVTFRYNRIMNAGGGLILGGAGFPTNPVNEPVNKVLIAHNTFENIDRTVFGGAGMVIQFADDAFDIVLDHNSMNPPLGTASIFFHYGARTGFVVTNNVLSGVMGSGKGYWNDMVSTYAPGGVFLGNALVQQRAIYYPVGNRFVDSVNQLFVNASAGNFSMAASSPLRGGGTGGTDIGADWNALVAATANVR